MVNASIDISTFQNSTTLVQVIEAVDVMIESQVGVSFLGRLTLLAVYIIVLFRMQANNPPAESFFIAGMVSTISSLLLAYLGMVLWVDVVIVAVLFGISAAILALTK